MVRGSARDYSYHSWVWHHAGSVSLVMPILILLERMTGWITTHWIAVAQADVEKGITWRLFDRTQVSVVRPGIDPYPFQTDIDTTTRDALRAQFGVGPAEYLVGTVACLKPQKAPEDFVAVATQVCKAVPNARFALIGDGDLRPRIESLIEAEWAAEAIAPRWMETRYPDRHENI